MFDLPKVHCICMVLTITSSVGKTRDTEVGLCYSKKRSGYCFALGKRTFVNTIVIYSSRQICGR